MRRAGRGGRGARRDRGRHPRPAADAGAGLAGARTRARRLDDEPARDLRSRSTPLPGPPLAEARALVGGKAANLGGDGPRPAACRCRPASSITTETCRAFLADGWPDGLDDELRARMAEVEAAVGRRFGDAADPLLVSVRSGAPVSMPGMMDTILDLGLNDATTAGLARVTGDEAFARACRERFEASFRSIVGVGRRPGRPVAAAPARDRGRLPLVEQRSGRDLPAKEGHPRRPRDGGDGPGDGLRQPRAGLRRPASLFTRDPATGEPDALRRRPVRRPGRGRRRRDASRPSRSPSSTSGCRRSRPSCGDTPTRLERHFADLCDIEFTIEDGPALDAPGPRRQAQPAGRAADRRRHGRGRRLPADAGGGGRARRAAARRSADDHQRAERLRAAARDRPAGVARDRQRADRRRARRRRSGRGRAGTAGDPRPRRDLARRRPRHGRGGRHPDLARRARQPRRGRGPRLGHPGRRRRGRDRGPATARSSSAIATLQGRRRHHHRRRHRRGLRRRGRRARPRSCRRRRPCSTGRPSSGSRSARDAAIADAAAGAREPPPGRRPDDCLRAHRDQGLRPDRRPSPTPCSRRRTTSSRSSTSWSPTAS